MKIFFLSTAMAAALALGFCAISQAQTSPDSAPGNADRGKTLFGNYGCFECHGWEGQGSFQGARIAPNPMPVKAFISYVRAPKGVMPPYSEKLLKSDQDLVDIWAYLKARKPPVPVTSLKGR